MIGSGHRLSSSGQREDWRGRAASEGSWVPSAAWTPASARDVPAGRRRKGVPLCPQGRGADDAASVCACLALPAPGGRGGSPCAWRAVPPDVWPPSVPSRPARNETLKWLLSGVYVHYPTTPHCPRGCSEHPGVCPSRGVTWERESTCGARISPPWSSTAPGAPSPVTRRSVLVCARAAAAGSPVHPPHRPRGFHPVAWSWQDRLRERGEEGASHSRWGPAGNATAGDASTLGAGHRMPPAQGAGPRGPRRPVARQEPAEAAPGSTSARIPGLRPPLHPPASPCSLDSFRFVPASRLKATVAHSTSDR